MGISGQELGRPGSWGRLRYRELGGGRCGHQGLRACCRPHQQGCLHASRVAVEVLCVPGTSSGGPFSCPSSIPWDLVPGGCLSMGPSPEQSWEA